MNAHKTLTSTEIMGQACQVLLRGGYQQVRERFPEWDSPTRRLFEDEYNVVGLVVCETCSELIGTWADLQGALVEVISRQVGSLESKSWDGYLVLLTPGMAPSEESEVEGIRYNTTRVRKLVATGEELQTIADVDRILRPLLPFVQEQGELARESALEALPRLLAARGIPETDTQVLVDAFHEQQPLIERLHAKRASS